MDAEITAAESPKPGCEQLCPTCGYSLRGLAEVGRCPECGDHFDTKRLVLWGFEAKSRFRLGEYPLARVILLILVLGWAAGIIAFTVGGKCDVGDAVLLLLPTAFPLCEIWLAGLPRQMQLRPQGFAFRVGSGRVGFRKWGPDDEIGLRRRGTGRYVLTIRRLYSILATLEIACDDASAEELRERTQAFIGRRVALEK